MDTELLRTALAKELNGLTGKQRIGRIEATLRARGQAVPQMTEDTVHRFIIGDTHCPRAETLEAFRLFLKAANPDAYRDIEAPTSESARLALLDAITDFYVLEDGKQRRLGERLCGRYTVIRDAWMEGAARKDAVVFSEMVFKATPSLLTAHERQTWRDEELLEKEREEEEFGIAVQFRSNFALFLRSGHSSGGMILHIFDSWQEIKGRIVRATGISVPIVSRQEQIPTAILMTQRPLEELGGPRIVPRAEFLRDYASLGRRFVDTEVKHFLQGDRQLQLV